MAKNAASAAGRSKRRIAAISTLVLLGLGALGGFYVSRVNSRVSYLEQRNFRILATFAAGIESRIDNLGSILKGMEGLVSENETGDAADPSVVLDPFRSSLRCFDAIELGAATDGTTPAEGRSSATVKVAAGSLRLLHRTEEGGTIHAQADAACLFAWLSAPEAFDEILMLDHERRTIFQGHGSGVRVRTLAPSAKEGAGVTLAGKLTNVEEIELAGDHFMVFSQPVTMPLATQGEPADWELVGLVRSQRLLTEALRMHPSNLAKVAFGLLLSALAWPFLKLWTLGDRRALRARDALLCGLSLVMVTSLLTLGATGWAAYRQVRAETGGELQETANGVIAALNREIDESLDALTRIVENESRKAIQRSAEGVGIGYPAGRIGGLLEQAGLEYVHLDNVFFARADGQQTFKQSVEAQATPLIPVADRGYFTQVHDGRLWSRNRRRIAFESIRSRNTGEPLAVLAVPWANLWTVDTESAELTEPPLAAMVATRLPSLLHPILPPGREFAIVEESGRVLFHSRSERNLVENLVRECERASRLLAMMHARTGRPFEGSYWGSDRQMVVAPVPGLPWHVVAFQDKALLRTANFEALGLSAGLVLAQLFLVVLALVALRVIGGPRSLLRLCPGSEAVPCLRLVVVLGLLGSSLFLAPALLAPEASLIVGAALPVTAVGLGALTLLRRDWRPRRMRWTALVVSLLGSAGLLVAGAVVGPPPPGIWAPVLVAWLLALWDPLRRLRLGHPAVFVTAAGCAALAVLSVLPAFVFLQVVFEDRLALEVRRGQLHLARALAIRDARVKEIYSRVPGMDAHGRWHQILCDTWDVHYASFAGTTLRLQPEHPAGQPHCSAAYCLTACGLPGSGAAWSRTRETPPWSVFARPDHLGLPFINDQAIQGRLVEADALDGHWSWRRTLDKGRLVLRYGPDAGRATQISSEVPRFRLSGSPSAWALFVSSALVVLILLLLFLRRMLLIDLRRDCPTTLAKLVDGGPLRRLVVCPPEATLPVEWQNADLALDLAACDLAGLTEALGRLDSAPASGLVSIDHVEAGLASPWKRRALREFLERVLERPETRLVVVARRSPGAIAGGMAGDRDSRRLREIKERLAVRWAADLGESKEEFTARIDDVFANRSGLPEGDRRVAAARQVLLDECCPDANLQLIGLSLAGWLDLAKLEREELVQRVREEAADHYRTLCGALSDAERLVLCQIADGGVPVPAARPVLERLLSWGLVLADPALRPMNDSFREHVLAAQDRRALQEWQDAGASDLWRHLRVPFFAVLAAAAGFLVLTQPGLFNSAVALASVVAAGVPTLVRAAGALRQGFSAARGAPG